MKKLTGIFPALVTPYHEDGTVNTEAVGQLVESCLEKGVSGFYVGGSTGESYLLTPEERMQTLEAVMKTVDGRVDVIANIGTFSTAQGIELAKRAEAMGVSAVSSVPPFYFPFTLDEYFHYYEDIAGSVSVPVVIYNIPVMSGVHFTMEDIDRLLGIENVAGMKHTSYDLFQLERVLKKYPEKSIFCGHDELFLSASAVGVEAAIGSTFNFMAEKFVKMQALLAENRWEDARKIQSEANAVIEALCRVGVFKGVKAALKMQGIDCGTCRKPFQELTAGQTEYLRNVLSENGCLTF